MLWILFGCLPEVKLGTQTRAVTFVYVVAGETVYKRHLLSESEFASHSVHLLRLFQKFYLILFHKLKSDYLVFASNALSAFYLCY